MRKPFKTETELSQRLAACSEAVRLDYYRRLEQASLAVLSAHLEKEQAAQAQKQALSYNTLTKKINLSAIIVLLFLAAGALATEFLYIRVTAVVVVVFWIAYLAATELFFLPNLHLKQSQHWNSYLSGPG
jgi:hypothetical protein